MLSFAAINWFAGQFCLHNCSAQSPRKTINFYPSTCHSPFISIEIACRIHITQFLNLFTRKKNAFYFWKQNYYAFSLQLKRLIKNAFVYVFPGIEMCMRAFPKSFYLILSFYNNNRLDLMVRDCRNTETTYESSIELNEARTHKRTQYTKRTAVTMTRLMHFYANEYFVWLIR